MERVQPIVELRDLLPVGVLGARRLGVHGRDRSLERIGPRRRGAQRFLDERAPFVELRAIPARSILMREQHQLARRVHPRLAPRIVQQHERVKRVHLGDGRRQERTQEARQANGLGAQLAALQRLALRRRVAFVEHQVDDRHYLGEPLGKLRRRRHAIGDARVLDLVLGAHQPLRHGRGRHQERARDLLGGEAAQRAQGERDLRLGGERRVTAGEDQPQPLVGHRALLAVAHLGLDCRRQGPVLAGDKTRLPSQSIDRLVPRGAVEPRARVRRRARRPLGDGGGERVLQRLLGDVEVTDGADEPREQAPPLRAAQAIELAHRAGCSNVMIGRTSIEPWRAPGILLPMVMASSRSGASIR